MPRRKTCDGQVPCPRADCSTTLSRITDIPRHIKNIHDVDVDKWACPYLNCKFKPAKRRDNAVAHIKEKHLMREPQGNTIGGIYPEPIVDGSQISQRDANRGGASSMTSGSSFQGLTNSSFNNPQLHNAYTKPHAARPSTTKHLTTKCFIDYESSYQSPTPYPTAGVSVKPHPPMFFHSNHFGADEDSQVSSTDGTGNNWSVWDDGVAMYDWENFEVTSNRAYTHDWIGDQN